MSEEQWAKGPLFDPPHVRHQVEQQMKIERPAECELRQVVAPPMPDQRLQEVLWQTPVTEQAPEESLPIAQLGLALYFLHALHAPDKPGFEHLPRSEEDVGPPEEGREDARW
jgi:hypothetical protein